MSYSGKKIAFIWFLIEGGRWSVLDAFGWKSSEFTLCCHESLGGIISAKTNCCYPTYTWNLPDRKSFSIISKLLLAGPKVANCLVAFLNLIGKTLIPMAGSTVTADIDNEDVFCAHLPTSDLDARFRLKPRPWCLECCPEWRFSHQ